MVLFSVMVHNGFGRHTVYLSLSQQQLTLKLQIIANPFIVLAASLPYVSVALLVNRILAPEPLQKWRILSVTILQSLIAFVQCVLFLTTGVPIDSTWNPNVKPTTCLPTNLVAHFSYSNTGSLNACLYIARF